MSLPLAITGRGAVAAPGRGAALVAAAIAAGQCGLTRSHDLALPLNARLPTGRVEAAVMDAPGRTTALALTAASEALAEAGLPRALRRDVGLIVATCTGGMAASETAWFAQGPEPIMACYASQPVDRVAAHLARTLGLRGPRVTHNEACASTALALSEAMMWIRAGRCATVLVVGADALTRLTMAGFHALRVVDPDGCRPFTRDRAGMSLGEGACAFVCENPSTARARGVRIHGSLLGWGARADGHHPTAPAPDGTDLAQALREALADAHVPAEAVGFAAAHGTGTRDNDPVEAAVLDRVLPAAWISSHKHSTGHTLGAAAGFGVLAALDALHHRRLPISGGCSAATALPDVRLALAPAALHGSAAVVTSLAFGGVNAALVIGGAELCA